MSQMLQSPYFGIALTLLAYWFGVTVDKRFQSPFTNSMIVAVGTIIVVLLTFDISYDDYNVGASMVSMLLSPATACLGVSIYNKRDVLKAALIPVLAGCIAGTLTSVISVGVLCKLFLFSDEMTYSILPKSVTTAIAQAIAQDYGGIPAVAALAVAFAGIGGNLVAPTLAKLFRVKNPVAEGLAIGACSHGMGTAKALQIGETQGAMSGLAMGLCGIFTAIVALAFPYFI